MADSSNAQNAIRQLDADFMKAANGKDAAGLVNRFYADNAVLLPPGSPAVEGRGAIQKFFQGFIDAGATNVTLDTTTIESSGDLAYGRGRVTFSMGGKTEVGKYVVVYRRQSDGSWRAIADIFNTD